MWNGKTVSIVFPCYNEEENVRNAIEEFFNSGYVDEIIAVDNNSSDNTKNEILKTRAKYVFEERQGYGIALRRGMHESTGDIIITSEPDNSFIGKDVLKYLVYSDEFDVIFGTRTAKSLIWGKAKMDQFLRYGNVIVAKILEYLHNGPCLTDVGCTMKLIHRKSYEQIKRKLSVDGQHFSPEFMVIAIRSGLKCVEIPVNYRERVGESKITSTFWKSFWLGGRMVSMIIGYRFKKL
jgi:glycosyltransferase involved in cell wall biosynthesis